MRPIVVLPIALALAACSGGSANPTRGADSGRIVPIPAADDYPALSVPARPVPNYVRAISYDPETQVLRVAGDPFDMSGAFRRSPRQDVQGFAAFENEAGARRYLALVRSENGVAAGVVGTPIRLDNEFGGLMVARDEIPSLPRNLEATHTGTYAGVRNVGANVGGDASDAFLHRVEGRVRLDFDFFDDNHRLVEGVIYDRRSMDQTVTDDRNVRRPLIYDDVVLRCNLMNAPTCAQNNIFEDHPTYEDGAFRGEAAIRGTVVGEYHGVIADSRATTSAGVVQFIENGELERGAFTATQR